MFIKRLKVDKFKKLENFELDFPESKIMGLEKDKEMRLSVIIGENGTAKTTIFELIINSFLPIRKFKFTGEYEVEYTLNGKNYTKTSYNEFVTHPFNLVVSSYTPIDRLDITRAPEGSESFFLQKMNINKQSIKKISTRILKKIASNKIEEIYSILKYVRYEKKELYFELSSYQLRPYVVLSKLAKKIKDKKYNLLHLNLNDSLEEKTHNYENVLDKLSSEIGIYQKADFFKNKIEEIFSGELYHSVNIKDLNLKEKHLILELLFILEKFSLLSKNKKNQESFHENGKKKLLSITNISYYPNGNKQLLKDLEFLDGFSFDLFDDVWLANSFSDDPFPISMFSSGELSMFIRFFDLLEHVKKNSIVLIDEPETHLHPKWIRGYIKTLIELLGDRKCHVIIATHSPLIVSDVTKNCIIGLKKERNSIKQVKVNDKTLGLNYEDVLSDIFDVEDSKGEMINEYVDVIEKSLGRGDIDKALEIYSQIADSETKYQLFLRIKEFRKIKGERDV